MKKQYLLAIIPFLLAFCCIVAYEVIGQKITADGTLVEAFYLIPLTFLFSFVGIATTVGLYIYSRVKK